MYLLRLRERQRLRPPCRIGPSTRRRSRLHSTRAGRIFPGPQHAGTSLGWSAEHRRPESTPFEPELGHSSVGKRRRQASSPVAPAVPSRAAFSFPARLGRETNAVAGIAMFSHQSARLGAGRPLLRLPGRGVAAPDRRGAERRCRLPGRRAPRHAAGAGRDARRHVVRRHPRRRRVLRIATASSNWLVFGVPYYVGALLFAWMFARRARDGRALHHPRPARSRTTAAARRMVGALAVFVIAAPAAYVLMLGTLFAAMVHAAARAVRDRGRGVLALLHRPRRPARGGAQRPGAVRAHVPGLRR